MAMLLEVVGSFYLVFTGDLMENPLEKSLKLYVSYSGLLKGMFAEILIREGARVTISYNAPQDEQTSTPEVLL